MKKLISFILITCISMCSSLVYASEPADMTIYNREEDTNIRNALLASEDVSEDDKKILRGEDFGYGNGLNENREWVTYPGAEYLPMPAWAGGGTTYTHQYITRIAMFIIDEDLGYNPLNSHTTALATAADLPDEDEDDYFFVWHFYDPDTGKNYSGGTDTALSKFVSHYNTAVSNYSSNVSSSIESLGRALHYLQDLSEPHHASNKIAGVSQHTQFESYANDNRQNYYTFTMGSDSYNYGRNTPVSTMGHNFAVYAKSKINLAENSSTFDTAASDTMTKAQRNTACVLYKFMIDVGLVD